MKRHSDRSALSGSTRNALLTGTEHAITVTIINKIAAAGKIQIESLMSATCCDTSRLAAIDNAPPATTPAAVTRNP